MNLDQSNAFMIRNDGEIFNVRTHPYGNEDIEYVDDIEDVEDIDDFEYEYEEGDDDDK